MSSVSIKLTYLEMIERLKVDKRISAGQRIRMISAIKCFVRTFEGRGLTTLVLPTEVNSIVQRATAAKAGISERSFRNMISRLRRALLLCSIIHQPGRHNGLLRPCWSALLPPPNTSARWQLSRFFHLASERGWEPREITVEHFRIFHSIVESSVIGRQPRGIVADAVWQWNRLARCADGIAEVEYQLPHPRPRFSLRWDAYPASFQQELQSFFEKLSKPAYLSQDGHQAWRPKSVATFSTMLRLFVGALVLSGQSPSGITSLSQLCTFDAFETGLNFLIDRANGLSPQVLGVGEAVYALARRHPKTDPTELERIKNVMGKLRGKMRPTGLSERNIRKLAQFDDPKNRDALLQLPQQLYAIAKKERASGHFSKERAASCVLTAVAIELLLMCPMRLSNLASLDLQKHIQRHATAKSLSIHLRIPKEEVKNGTEIHFELPEQSARLLEDYINNFRPDLPHKPSTYLFPGKLGRRTLSSFYMGISKTVRRHTGLEVNPHFFRHLAAKFYLDENPGGYEVVRRTLGHKSMNTTVLFYAGQETSKTFRHFDETILRRRQQADERSRFKKPGRRR